MPVCVFIFQIMDESDNISRRTWNRNIASVNKVCVTRSQSSCRPNCRMKQNERETACCTAEWSTGEPDQTNEAINVVLPI